MSYIISLVVGLAFGIGYGLLGVKSPAPPIVALFGLLGMVIGEQGVPWVKHQIQSPQHVSVVTRSASSDASDEKQLQPPQRQSHHVS